MIFVWENLGISGLLVAIDQSQIPIRSIIHRQHPRVRRRAFADDTISHRSKLLVCRGPPSPHPHPQTNHPPVCQMPVKVEPITAPPPPAHSKQLGFSRTLLYNGSRFEGSQKSKGNSYAVEVVLQVSAQPAYIYIGLSRGDPEKRSYTRRWTMQWPPLSLRYSECSEANCNSLSLHFKVMCVCRSSSVLVVSFRVIVFFK